MTGPHTIFTARHQIVSNKKMLQKFTGVAYSWDLSLSPSPHFLSLGSVPASVTKQQHLTSTRCQETGEA